MPRTIEKDDLLLLIYSAFSGKISGRTKLQKVIYFIGCKLDLDNMYNFNKLGYGAHYFGPYSGEMDNLNAQLDALGFLRESRCHTGRLDEKGFEICRFDYHLTKDGESLAKKAQKNFPDHWKAISSAAKIINDSNLNYVELSIAAKAYFLLNKKGGKATVEQIVKAARPFGWEIEPEAVERVSDFLVALGLISKN